MARLIDEAGTGRKSNLAGSLRGDFTLLAGLEADLKRIDSYDTAVTSLLGKADVMQGALSSGRDLASETASQVITVTPPANQETIRVVAEGARGRFEDFAARLNVSYAGATVFSGTGTDRAALAPASDILSALEAAVAPFTTADEVEVAVRDWFAVGGDFDTLGYTGETDTIAGLSISATRQIAFDVTAADPAIRETFVGLALAALSDRVPLSGNLGEQERLMVSSAEQLLDAQNGLAQLQGRIGAQEQELIRTESRNAAERAALEMSRSELIDVDIFETASRLEAVQSQIELLYTITARSAQFSLVRFLQ
ncbi:MAG: flagellin [Pseudomonadota bacterium]